MSKTNFSVIIPVYNAERYLEECLDSVLRQTYMPEKIVLVDDGSTDKSGIICDRYGREHSDIMVIHQINQGVSSSRKNGVEYVDTTYVTFIDADDWIDVDLFEQMYAKVYSEDADVVVTGMVYEFGNSTEKTAAGIKEGIYSRKAFHKQFLTSYIFDYQKQRQGILPSLCAKLFRTNILKRELTELDPRLSLGEDGAVVYPLLAKAEVISISAYCGYHYRCHETSRMTKLSTMDFYQVELLQKHLFRKFDEIGLLELGKQQIDLFLLGSLKKIIRTIFGIEISEAGIILPCFDIPINSRIVVYGAGKVGMAYMREFLYYKQYVVVLWVDRYRKSCCYGYEIVDPQKIAGIDYDYVLIAIEDKNISEKVKNNLNDMGIVSEKIIWFPVHWRQ